LQCIGSDDQSQVQIDFSLVSMDVASIPFFFCLRDFGLQALVRKMPDQVRTMHLYQ